MNTREKVPPSPTLSEEDTTSYRKGFSAGYSQGITETRVKAVLAFKDKFSVEELSNRLGISLLKVEAILRYHIDTPESK